MSLKRYVNNQLIFFILLIFLSFVFSWRLVDIFQKVVISEKEQQSKYLVESVHSLMSSYYQLYNQGLLTEQNAKDLVLRHINSIRYSDSNYFWVNDTDLTMLVHPFQPDIVGQNVSKYGDLQGKNIFQEFDHLVAENGEGTLQYSGILPGYAEPELKISYVKLFEPWNLIIGTGVNVSGVNEAYKRVSNQVYILLFFAITSILLFVYWFNKVFVPRRTKMEALEQHSEFLENRIIKRTEVIRKNHQELKQKHKKLEKYQEQTKLSEIKFKSITGAMYGGVIVFDQSGQIEFFNNSFLKILELPNLSHKKNFLVFDFFESPLPGNIEELFDFIKNGNIQQKFWNEQQNFFIKSKSSLKPIELAITSFNYGQGWKGLAVVHDITERVINNQNLIRINLEQKKMIVDMEAIKDQLVQSEKLASLGELAAGVAHEINNPVGFVASNLNRFNQYIDNLLGLVSHYDSLFSKLNLDADSLSQMSDLKEKYDLHYIIEDSQSLFEDSSEGLSRIKNIVADLKYFARSSSGQFEQTNIEKEIDTTINIVANEIKYHCEVIKDYGEIGLINCLRSELNQVFMNLIVNASHAIEKKGVITIQTRNVDNDVIISITDNGCGISKNHLKQLFDPFFTTKPVGKGTGLGLSVSYGIVMKHKGSLTVKSKIGHGSTFTIKIPRNIQFQNDPEKDGAKA